MNILHISGLEYPQKYGGLERWFVAFGNLINNKNGNSYIAFSEKITENNDLINDFNNSNIKQLVIPNNDKKSLIDFIKHNKIDVVFCHFENTFGFIEPAKKAGCKVYWYLHCENYYSVNNTWKNNIKIFIGVQIFRLKYLRINRFVDAFFFGSNKVREGYQNFYQWDKNKCITEYLGLLSSQLNNNRKKICNNKIVITCIAFHGKIKGVDVLVRSASLLKLWGYEFTIKQIGASQISKGNTQNNSLNNLAKELNVEKNIEWLGLRSDIIEILLKSDIYCQPSRSEALSFTIMEAMSCGLPIVATNVGGIPEIVFNDVNGYLVEPDNPEELALALKKLIDNKQKREQLGEKSYNIINDANLNTEKNISRIVSMIEKQL